MASVRNMGVSPNGVWIGVAWSTLPFPMENLLTFRCLRMLKRAKTSSEVVLCIGGSGKRAQKMKGKKV